MHFSARRLYAVRKRAKLRAIDVAYPLNLNLGSIYRWESGRAMPSAGTLARLAAFFDVPVTEFFEEDKARSAVP